MYNMCERACLHFGKVVLRGVDGLRASKLDPNIYLGLIHPDMPKWQNTKTLLSCIVLLLGKNKPSKSKRYLLLMSS